jgi:hypothetical protein
MPSIAQTIIIPAIKRSTGQWMEWQTTTTSSDVGAGTFYPIGFTFDELVRFFYGVKDYTFAGSVSGFTTPPFGPTRGCNASYTTTRRVAYRNDNTNPIFGGYTDETEYVTEARARMFLNNEILNVGPDHGNLLAIFMEATFGAPDTGDTPVTGFLFGSLYYPHIIFSWNFTDAGTSPAEGGIMGISSREGVIGTALTNGLEFYHPAGPFTGDFLGKSLSYWGYSSNGLPGTFTSSSLVVSSTSWWPYNPGDGGGACWDASDGSQLRSDLPGLT